MGGWPGPMPPLATAMDILITYIARISFYKGPKDKFYKWIQIIDKFSRYEFLAMTFLLFYKARFVFWICLLLI